jgi:predicted homoserine dehydrogenase-like protein
MNHQSLLATSDNGTPVTAGLIGVGEFGLTLLAQSRHIPGLSLRVLCDQDPDRVRDAALALGWPQDRVGFADSGPQARALYAHGGLVVTDDWSVALDLPVDVLVEATGSAETGARTASTAIANGMHLVLVTKETDAVIGPLLSVRARSAGVVLSQVDGDQPSLTMGLVSWARTLGLTVACAGKASEYDFVIDMEAGRITADEQTAVCPDAAALWQAPPRDLAALVAARAEACRDLPIRTTPDYCEMCLVANGLGLKPDVPEMHCPIARTVELPDLFRPREHGGLLGGPERLDVFNCFRRPDEISFAGGVFVIAALPDAKTGTLFAEKGIPVSDDRRYALIYNPTHLLGVEAPMSILSAARLGRSTGSDEVRPVCDVHGRATRDLEAGTELTEGKRHRIDGVEARLADYTATGPGRPVPLFMVSGRTLIRDVAAGSVLSYDDFDAPSDSLLWQLRAEQDGA